MKKTVSLATLVLTLCLLSSALAQEARRYTIDFADVDIRKVIETVSDITGRNFLVDDRVQGRVMVIGPKSLTGDEVYQVFLSILQVKGFTVVPAGKVEKIVPSANVVNYGLDMKVGKAGEESSDRYLTQVIPVQFAEAEDLRNLLAPIVPKTDSITAYPPTNLLIITTTESLLSRLAQIIAVVDVPGTREEIRILPVTSALATDLAQKVTQILESQAAKIAAAHRAARPPQPGEAGTVRGETKIIPDERTNSLIAIGDTQTLDRIAELVKKLDVPVPQGGGRVRVYYLQNADATELARVLAGLPAEATAGEAGKAPAAPQQPPQQARQKESSISIIADKATNSLVITATPEEYASLVAVIEKLDIPRDQVLVEVLIAEVSFTKTKELGVEWRTADIAGDGKYVAFGGTSFGEFNKLAVTFPNLPNNGLVVGAIGQNITFNGVEFPNLGALVRALKTDSEVNILSTPTIVTTDNQQAEIVVGQTVPFQTSQKFDANNQPVITFDYRDVGLTLRLTPQINKNRYVKLKIFSQLEALVSTGGQTTSTDLAPTTLKRKADTSVVVKDGTTVVLGGMIRDDKTEGASKVPILGDIPLLGALFRSSSTRTEKTNLLIFLTPHIITNASEMHRATRDKVREGQILSGPQIRDLGLDRDLPAAPDGAAPAATPPADGP